MRFVFRALGGGAIALACVAVLALGARPFIACAPGLSDGPGLSVLGVELSAGALLGDCALDREERRRRGAAEERSFTGRVGVIAYETATPVLVAYGEVRSGRTLELRAPAAGRLVAVSDRFRDGAAIAAGEALFEIDPADPAAARADASAALDDARAQSADAAAALTLARADLVAAEEQLRLRRRAVDRQRELRDRGTGSEALLEEAEIALKEGERTVIARDQARAAAETRVEQTRLAVRRAEIALSQADRAVSDTAVTAPFGGVLQIDPAEDAMQGAGGGASLGRLVAVNERLGALIDPGALEVAVRLSDSDFARLLDSQGALIEATAVVTMDLGPRRIAAPARLIRASATVAAGGGRLVYAAFSAALSAAGSAAEAAPSVPADPVARASLFRPGDFVEIRIEEPPLPDVARLPASAVSASGRLLVLEPDPAPAAAPEAGRGPAAAAAPSGRLVEVTLEILRRQDGAVLARGAPDGAIFVRDRTPQLGAGVRFRVVGPAADRRSEDGAEARRDAAGRPREAGQAPARERRQGRDERAGGRDAPAEQG